MDFAKLFKSVEDAVYEVMVWLLLLPKTFFPNSQAPHGIHAIYQLGVGKESG